MKLKGRNTCLVAPHPNRPSSGLSSWTKGMAVRIEKARAQSLGSEPRQGAALKPNLPAPGHRPPEGEATCHPTAALPPLGDLVGPARNRENAESSQTSPAPPSVQATITPAFPGLLVGDF